MIAHSFLRFIIAIRALALSSGRGGARSIRAVSPAAARLTCEIYSGARTLVACMAAALLLLAGVPLEVAAQDHSNVVVVEVTEPGFLFDGRSIFDAQFRSMKGAPLVVEPYSVRGAFGPLARYYVHGLTDEHLVITAPDHEEKTVSTAGQTFVDVWLHRTKSSPYPISSRYWHGPLVPSFTSATAALFRDNSDLFIASSEFSSGRIAISRMDRAPIYTAETSATGASLSRFRDRLFLAWQGTGNRLVNVMSSANGADWEWKHTFDEITVGRPAIAGNDTGLALLWTGVDRHLHLMFSADGVAWGPRLTLPDQSDMSPAAIWVGHDLYLSWFGRGNQTLNVGRWRSDNTFEKIGSADTSDDAPSLSMLNGNLTVSWAGTGNRLVNTLTIDTHNLGFGQKQTFALTSDRTPTVLSYRWSGAGDQGVALPLFITSRGPANVAERYWSDLNVTPNVQAEAIFQPSYVVASIIYAPPGTSGPWAKSTVEYRENAGFGTSLAVASTFKQGTKLTAEIGPVAVGTGLTLSTQDQETTEVRVNTSTSTRVSGASTDGVNHDDDLIVLWLNPEVTVSLTSSDTRWKVSPRQGEAPRTLGVYVRWLKHPASMPAGVVQTLSAAGIGPDEYPKILSHNPFAAGEVVNVDVSRFVPLNTTVRYEPPPTPGTVPPASTFSLSTLSSHSSSVSSEMSYDVNMTLSGGFNVGIVKASLKAEQTWTWTSKTSRGSSSSSEQVATLSLTGPAYEYSGPVTLEVYWDALYRSFVFVPWEPWNQSLLRKAGETGIGLSGTLVHADGSPATHTEVLLQYPDGRMFRAFTGFSGAFDLPRAPHGPAIITIGTRQEPIVVGASSVVISLESSAPGRTPEPTNAGFEYGMLDWNTWSANSQYTAAVQPTMEQRGQRGRLQLAQEGGDGVVFRDIAGLAPGQRYELSALLNTSGTATGRLILHDTRESNYLATTPQATNGTWRRVSLTYTADATGAVRIHLARDREGSGVVLWDNVEIRRQQ